MKTSHARCVWPLLAVVLVGCPLPASYLKGEQAMRNQEYPRAVEYFELALREKPGDLDIKKNMQDAKKSAARLYFQRAMSKADDDLWGRFDDLDAALSFSPDDPDLNATMNDVEKRQGALQQQLNSVYEWLNADQPGRALEDYKPLARFEPYFAPLQTAGKVVVRQYCHVEGNTALTELANLRVEEARRHYQEVLKYEPDNTRAKAGIRSIDGLERLQQRDFEAALNFFKEAVSIDSGFDFARERLRLARRGMLTNILKEGFSGFERAQTPAAITKLLDLNAAALSLADQSDPERTLAEDRLQTLRRRLSKYYLKNASEALSHAPSLPATALGSFQAAHFIEPEAAQPVEGQAAKALSAVREKQKLNLVVHFEADKGSDTLSSMLHEGVVAALDAAALPGLNLVTREHLRDLVLDEESLAQGFSNKKSAGVDLETADLILLGRVVKNKVHETGAERPVVKRSTYISGVRQVRNPAYGEAEAAVSVAQGELEKAKRSAESASSAGEGIGGLLGALGVAGAANIGRVAGAVGTVTGNAEANAAQTALSEARAKLNNTPPTLDKEVISSYAYKEYNVAVDVDLRVSFRLIDRRTSLMQKAELVQASAKKTGLSREDVDPSDQQGLKNLDGPLPDKEEVRTQVQTELQAALSKRVIDQIGAFRRARWATAAKSAKTQRLLADQLENSLLYLDLVSEDDAESGQVEDFTFETAGLSRRNRRLAKYHSANVKEGEEWPTAGAGSAQP